MKIFKQFQTYFLLLILGFLSFFIYQIKMIGIPLKFLILFVLFCLFLFFLSGTLLYSRHRITRIFACFWVILLAGGSFYAGDVIAKTYQAFKQMEDNSQKVETINYSIIENKLYDTAHGEAIPKNTVNARRKFAVLEVGNTTFNRDIIKALREEFQERINFLPIHSLSEAEASLKSGETELLVINEAARALFDTDLDSFTTVVRHYEFQNNREIVRHQAKVTQEPFIVYVSGIDVYGSLARVSRSDVNKIVAVNPLAKDILMIDIPRDYYVPFPNLDNAEDKLTHSGIYGIDCSVDTLNKFLGIEINYYARINFSTFVELVDAIGGVDVEVKEGFYADPYTYPTGPNHLDGKKALRFARERHNLAGGDNARIRNQSLLLKAIIDKIVSPEVISDYPELMKIMAKNIETNMTVNEMTSLIQMQLNDMAAWNIRSYALKGKGATRPSAASGGRELYVMLPDGETVEKAKELIEELFKEIY